MKKNIGLLIPMLSHGGAERAICRLSYILDEDGYNVYMIVFDSSIQKYEYAGQLISLECPASSGIIGRILTGITRIRLLKKVKRDKQLDVVISYLDGANIVNILSRCGEKCMVSIRNYKSLEIYGQIEKIYHLGIRLLYNKADYIIAVTKMIAEDLVNNYGLNRDKIKVIYNPFSPAQIENEAKEKLPTKYKLFYEEHRVLVSVGRLMYQKGYWNLIKVLKIVRETIPNAGVVIVGDGEMEASIRRLSIDCGVSENVLLVGYQRNPYPFIKNSEVYVLTSLFEGFPNALMEAMCCGIPIVSNDCKSGPREILSENIDLNMEIQESILCEYGIITPRFKHDKFGYDCNNINKEQIDLAKSIINVLIDQRISKKYSMESLKRANIFSNKKCLEEWKGIIEYKG